MNNFCRLKESRTLFQSWIIYSHIVINFILNVIIKSRISEIHTKYFNGDFDHTVCLALSVLSLYIPACKTLRFEFFFF